VFVALESLIKRVFNLPEPTKKPEATATRKRSRRLWQRNALIAE
jgi:hypothetical protein